MERSKRFDLLAKRDINKETFVEPWPEAGLIVADSPYDPQPSIKIESGRVIEMDGAPRADFDALDIFIVSHALDLDVAETAMALPSRGIRPHVGRYQRAAPRDRPPDRGLHTGEADRHHPPYECAGDDDGFVEDARAADAGQSGSCDQLARASGIAGG